MHHVELSKRAQRDLRRIHDPARARVLRVLEQELTTEPHPPNLDVKPLAGRTPWLRLRQGDYRVIYRPLTPSELRDRGAGEERGFLVERVVDRKGLERAAATLPS